MIIVVTLLLVIMPFFLGCLVRKILDFQRANAVENYLCGCLASIAVSGGIQLLLIITKRPFSNFMILYPAILGILFIVGIVIFVIDAKQSAWSLKRPGNAIQSWFRTKKSQIFTCLMIATFFIGIAQILLGTPILKGDFTLETIKTTLETDSIYQYHSLTGRLIEAGMPIRKEILTLPIFYSFLVKSMGVSPELLIYKLVPCFLLILTYLGYGLWAGVLFPSQRETQSSFLFLIGVLLNFGGYSELAPANLLIHQGFTGEAWVACLILPLTICFAMKNQWILALLCVVSEAFLIWTTYGFGFSALVIMGFALLHLGMYIFHKKKKITGNSKRKA